MILPAVAGLLIIVAVLWEAFETVVLPRRVTRRFRFTVLFYRLTWRPWRAIASKIRNIKLRETFLSYFGPLSLLMLVRCLRDAADIRIRAGVFGAAQAHRYGMAVLDVHLPERNHFFHSGHRGRYAAHIARTLS